MTRYLINGHVPFSPDDYQLFVWFSGMQVDFDWLEELQTSIIRNIDTHRINGFSLLKILTSQYMEHVDDLTGEVTGHHMVLRCSFFGGNDIKPHHEIYMIEEAIRRYCGDEYELVRDWDKYGLMVYRLLKKEEAKKEMENTR